VLVAWLASAAPQVGAAGPSWTQQGGLPGLGNGHVWQIIFSPVNNNVAFAATDHGVYTSTDSGQNWTQTRLSSGRVWTVGFDVRTPTTMFAGLQDGGVRLSTDSGATWSDASVGLPNRNVRCFAFSLGGIAAGTDTGVALSTDGHSWHAGGLETYAISALAVSANAPAPQFLAGVDSGNVAAGYLWRSGGNGHWDVLSNGLPGGAVVNAIAVGPISTTVTTRPIVANTSKGTVRSGDGGGTWTASTGVPEGLSATTSTFSPLDPAVVYAGADAGGSSGGGLIRSTDGGASFVVADNGLPGSSGPNQPARKEVATIAVAATNPPVLLAAVNPFDGGGTVYRETDTGVPAPPALITESGVGATIPPVAATPPPTPRATARPVGPTATPAPGPVGRVAGAVVGFPIPIVPEILLIVLAVVMYLRWRRKSYVEGPP